VSDKLEYAAYTIRPKIRKLLPEYLEEFPKLKRHPYNIHIAKKGTDWDDAVKSLRVDKNVRKVDWLKPGEEAAKRTLEVFLDERLYNYDARRNDPNENAQSDLSPYLHFGQISAQRVALEAERYGRFVKSTEAFLEELIVRRELSDNYCRYNPDYDNLRRLPNWSSETLSSHRRDKREYVYTADEFENASTHDPLWNAAQREMVRKGKMHGYMRMYWAKKILEWSKTPEEAMQTAIYLNDRYELDGSDPNGYAGIAWSIGGVHDRPWFDRPVYGKIRSMTYDGCKRKFGVEKYISVNG
jgi:deoxyribodipyrimidine photo-lyase